MIKGLVQEEVITIINIYAHKIEAPQYIRQTLTDIKGEIDSNTRIVGDFNSPLTPMDRSSKQKINKETQVLNDTLDEMDLIDVFRPSHPNAEEYRQPTPVFLPGESHGQRSLMGYSPWSRKESNRTERD